MLEKCKKSAENMLEKCIFGLLFCVFGEITLSLPSIIDVFK